MMREKAEIIKERILHKVALFTHQEIEISNSQLLYRGLKTFIACL